MEDNKFYGIMRQRNNVEELDRKIRDYNSKINVAKNKMKLFKKWAIIPPIVILAFLVLGTEVINNIFMGSTISLVDMLAICKETVLIPLILSVGFPVFYGLQYYAENENLKKMQNELVKLENFRQINERSLEVLEKDFEKTECSEETLSNTKSYESNRRAILEEFYACEKEKLKHLYDIGKLGSFVSWGWSVSDVVYLQSLIEEEIKRGENETLEKENGMKLARNKPQSETKN